MPRGFVVFAQNTATTAKTFRFSIAAQPTGGVASFTQSSQAGAVYPLTSLDVTVAPKSMVTRTVFVTSSDAKAQVPVDIREVAGPGLPLLSGGLTSRVLLNPDVSNPEISNPEISNPEISNPEISNAEIYNPEISNPEISNPEISNPEISNPEISNPEISNARIANPEISNPEISNPEISNPEISNPEISNPEISNADIANGAITDVTWRVVNTGNTTTSFNVNLFLADAAAKLAGPGGSGVTGGIKTQLVVHKFYSTPIAIGCELKQEPHTVLVANVPFPTFRVPGTSTAFDPTNPSVSNTTLWLEPGGEGRITLRIVDPNPQDNITLDPVHDVTPVVTAEPKNTPDLGSPTTPPPSTTPPPAPNTTLAITAQPSDTPLSAAIAPITVHVAVNGAPAAGAQVTIAIAINPAGGHLAGTTTILTDAAGNATFSGLSIDRAGVGYRLSASASASGALPYLSAPFTIGVAAPPLPPSSWTATGDGVVALANDGLAGGTPRMTYANNGFGIFNGAWTVSTVAASNGAVRLDWEWSGFHSYCLASVQLVAFVNRNGVDVFTSPLLQLTDNCVGAQNPSASFDFAGGMPLSVQANDRFGFRLAGSHNDGTYVMEGAFGVVVNGATSASPYVVTNASDGGPGSLRAALAAANAAPDLNTITFAIPGAWVHNIAPATPLPVVSNPVVIDGLSQPGAASMAPTVNINGRFMQGQISDALGHYYGDDLPGTNIGLAPGFEVTASNVTIRGLGINGFPGPGVYVHNLTSGVRVEDSAIGAGLPGVHTWPSNGSGVHVNYASNAVIARNVISSSRASGIIVAGGSGHSVTANRIGTSLDGLAALPNGDNGITLYDGASGTIIDGNLISGNGVFGQPNGHGIDIQQSGALAQVTNTVIRNNVIGLDANGNLLVRGTTLFALGFGPVERGNAGDGIHVNSAPGTIVGGVGTGNVIAGNRFSGVAILGTPSGATPRIIGNRIGTNPAGTAARGNGREGVQVFLSSAIVGEPGVGAGNLVSGNISEGVQANGNTIVENNLIGTDVTGTLQLGNGRLDDVGDPNDPGCCHTGVFVDAPNNIVRGNVVAGSGGAGIRSDGGSGGGRNIIEDNKVGTDITGTFGIPNGEGIGLYNDQSTTIVRRNLVAYNSAIGIRLVEGTAGAMVGGLNVLDANIVRGNGGPGVAVGYSAATAETANSILSNAIYGNGSQAIDLGHNGPTANDAGDGDTGPNGLQNRPVIASAVNTTTTTVDFTLDGGAGTFLVQFFGGSVCGAAEQLIGSTSVGSGSTVFNLSVLVPAGTWISATATDAAGSTSELSPCVQVSGLSPSAVIASASPANGAVYVRLPAGQPLGAVPSASVGAGMSPVQSRPAPTAPPEPAWFEPGRQLP
jgi:hypothetical protein